MTTELVFGNSQAGAYIAGHRLAKARGLVESDVQSLILLGERYEPYVQFSNDAAEFHPAIIRDLRTTIAEAQPTCLVVALLGSDHWIYGVCNEPRAFDFLVPDLPDHPLTPNTELVPYDLLLRRFRGDLDWQFGLIRLVREFCDLPVFLIEAPPPVIRSELMLRTIYGRFRERMEQFGCPSTSFRYKMWWIWCHVAKQICEEREIHFVEGPPETRDANGFLNERYYLDGVHGNDEYGVLMVSEVASAKRLMRLM